MSYFKRIIKSGEKKSSHRQTLCKTSTGSSALNSARVRYHLLILQGETIQCQAQRYLCLCQRHANMSITANASKVLPKSLPELTSMSDDTITQKQNDGDCTRPIKYKLWIKKDVQYKTILSTNRSGGGH